MNTLTETLEFFLFITIELVVLFILITGIVELVLMYIPQEKLRKSLSGKGLWGNIFGTLAGSLTPFCACSTIPVTLGFLNAGVPFGSTMSFLIASPLLNPIIIGMLGVLVGVKAAIAYFIIVFAASVIFGRALQKLGFAKHIKQIRQEQATACCPGGEPGNEETNRRTLPLTQKLKLAWDGAMNSLRPVFWYLIIGVAVGAAIYGYMPEELILKIAGPDNLLAIPVAAVLGIPLYIRAESAIPIGIALMEKGMNIGAVVALIIGGAGMAIPEMTMLAGIFKRPLVAMIMLVIFLTAVICGISFSLIYSVSSPEIPASATFL